MENLKYTTVKVSGIIISISKLTHIPGYTETVLSVQLPSDEELKRMTKKQVDAWAKESNTTIQKVCDLMNKYL